MLTYQVTEDLYIGLLEEHMTHLRMGEQETATDYCNQARPLLANMRMAGVTYSTASYITHVVKGLPSSYNLMKRRPRGPPSSCGKRYVAPTKQGGRPGQRSKPGGGGSGGGKPAKDTDKGKSAKENDRGGGGQRRECWLCSDPDHLSYKCPDCDDSDDDDTQGRPREINQSSPTSGEQAVRGEAVTEIDVGYGRRHLLWRQRARRWGTVVLVGRRRGADRLAGAGGLALEAGEDFHAVVATVQANSVMVLLDSGCSHHLMGTKEAFVDLRPSGDIKHVRSFYGHTFPDKGSDATEALAVVHIDLCRLFRVAAKDGSLYFLLLKDCKTRFVWVRPIARKQVPQEGVYRLRGQQGHRPRPDLHVNPAAERHGRSGDEDSGGVGADDAAAHGRAAPLVASRSALGRLGAQQLGKVYATARDDATLAPDRPEARSDGGARVGLHGAVPGPRAAAQQKAEAYGQVGPLSRCVGGDQGMGAPDFTDNRVVTMSDVEI
ncbi:unnamed protein product [Closterium sp. NIES-53]